MDHLFERLQALLLQTGKSIEGELAMSNLEKYNKIFSEVFNVPKEALNEKFTFQDVPQWDSVAHLSLISELEDAFDIMFESEDILHYGSYLNGIEILKRYDVEF